MEIDQETSAAAAGRVKRLTGLSLGEATRLVEAALAGAVDQLLGTASGKGPVPSTLTGLRADQVRHLSSRLQRIPDERELSALYRITPNAARVLLASVRAQYQDVLFAEFQARMQEDATVVGTGSEEHGLTWTIRFSEAGTYETARAILLQLPHDRARQVDSRGRTLVTSRQIGETEVLDVLGLRPPGADS